MKNGQLDTAEGSDVGTLCALNPNVNIFVIHGNYIKPIKDRHLDMQGKENI